MREKNSYWRTRNFEYYHENDTIRKTSIIKYKYKEHAKMKTKDKITKIYKINNNVLVNNNKRNTDKMFQSIQSRLKGITENTIRKDEEEKWNLLEI
jgi:hypothetical protein